MDYEAEKIGVEKDKLAFEKTKLVSEEKRANWTTISVAVPLIVGILTVGFGFWSTKEQAKAQLGVEIAKAIMSAPTGAEGTDRVELLKSLLPAYAGDIVVKPRSDAGVTPSQKELFRAMVARDMKPRQMLDLYIALFPEDDWASRPKIRSATDPQPQSD